MNDTTDCTTEWTDEGDGRRCEERKASDRSNGTHPPGPKVLPVVGNTIAFLRDGLEFSASLHEYGDVVAYNAIGRTFVVVYDPELIESVLVSRNDVFWKGQIEMEFGDVFASNGIAFAEGEQWQRQRSGLQPVFTPNRIRTYADTIVAETAATADSWEKEGTIDLRKACSKLTLSILASTVFNIDLDGHRRGTVVRNAVDAIADRVDITGAMTLIPEWAPRTPTERRFDRAMADLDELIETLIAERDDRPDAHDDLLAVLLDTDFGDAMDKSMVRDQLVTFLFAGHETTALALTYALWLLSDHPATRRRLERELNAVCGSSRPTATDLDSLDYTEHVIKETLRLYPPVYIIYRQPRQQTTLGGYRISSDATLQLATYDVQRDPRWWDDPNSFTPERWTETTSRPEYAYLPFGGGPRHCIGMRFAMTELKLALATLTQRAKLDRVTESIDPSPSVLLDPGRVNMRVHPRDNR
ncbi:cytochrome P450 [Halocatena marina]|uniref:cytochrome P450 n=1 Tax=Halocatena marina TaxID=2934937 RepID=UPI00200D50B9|nr:cytochrome P450 [Halocatena marina]